MMMMSEFDDSGTVEDGMTIPSADAVAVRYTGHSKRGFIDGGAIIHEQTKHEGEGEGSEDTRSRPQPRVV